MKFSQFSDYYFSLLSLITIGILISIFTYFYYNSSQTIALDKGRTNQQIRIESLARKFETFSLISSQLSKFIQINISTKKLSTKEIEKKLTEYIQSAPNETIYGIGIWYEPFTQNPKRKYYGPYIHRNNHTDFKITYEWEDPTYNYHLQDWYQSGIKAQGKHVFIKPYFDKGIVYVTLSRAFFDEKQAIAGVISIDMILPQLQNIINSLNSNPDEQIYVTTDDDFLLGHPLEKLIYLQKTNKKTLIEYTIEDIDKLSQIDKAKWVKQKIKIPDLNWNILIESNPRFLLQELKTLKSIIIFSTIALWAFILLVIWTFKIHSAQKQTFKTINENNRLQLAQSAKMAALGEMAAGIAHEINNPLTIINGRTDKILKLVNSNIGDIEIIEKELIKIKDTTKRISKIISSLKTFSRSAENDQFTYEEIDKILNDVLELCEDKIKSMGIQLNFNVTEKFSLECRPTQIEQILVNLINNSCDAISNLEEKWILIDIKLIENKIAQITVSDSGHLTDENIIEKIMEPFFTTKEVGKGTGLGLSISHSLIKEHHGEFIFDKKAKNTTFIIRLPLKQNNT